MAELGNTITVKVEADSEFLRESIAAMLADFARWIDDGGYSEEVPYETLVAEFLGERKVQNG